MDLGLAGRRALVLGGTRGLGYACAKALAEEGVAVLVNGRDQEHGQAAAAALGEGASFLPGDVSDAAARAELCARAQAQGRPIDILITNAGGPPPGPFLEHDPERWHRALETNMLAAIDIVRRLVPDMVEAGFGRVVNITSFTVREPYPNMGLATGVRAGLTGAMAALAREVGDSGVTVNNLLPGLMDTGALERVYRAQAEREGISEAEAKARMAASIPMRRLGAAEDFGPFCAFLCSVHASYVTGQNITIDGGLVRSLL